jgi:beta-galactosidase
MPTFVSTETFRTLLLILAAALPATLPAQVKFKEPFAPQSGEVAPVEREHRAEISLNGLWQFQPVALPDKFREGHDPTPELPPVKADGWDATPIRIPSPWNVNSFADRKGEGGDFRSFPSYPAAWEKIKLGWLQRSFTVPAAWKGRRIQLHFEAAAGDVEVFVNGKPVGKHFGIFFPFDIDVTDSVVFGQPNELRLGIRKPSLFDNRRTEFGRREYQAGSFWGQHIVGIWQDVSLLALPAVRVADTYVKPYLDTDTLEVDLTLRNDTDAEVSATVATEALAWLPKVSADSPASAYPHHDLAGKESLSFPAASVNIPARGQSIVTLSAKVAGRLKPWSPSSPNLYGLVSRVSLGNEKKDTSYTRFGWRQTSLKDGRLHLNGEPIVLNGESWHFMGIPQMTRRYAWAWYKAARDANLNAVRLHAQPFPSFYLDVADEMGMLILDETAVWASDGGPKLGSDAFWKDTEQHLADLVLRDRNHPSIFGWSVSNEVHPIVKGVMRNPPGMMDTLNRHYSIWADICRKLDPTRAWISADGEDDGDGRLPTYVVHYGGTGAMDRGFKSGKPWGVGEAGNAYYGTPEQVAVAANLGDRPYESFLGRMEGVAIHSRDSLLQQANRNATYRSVFNMAWYALEPLAFGKKNLTTPPALTEGVFFTRFNEGEPGVQPERLGPYASTLNPGYDPSLPLYKPWPLFEAIRDAAANPAVPGKWYRDLSVKPAVAPQPPPPAAVGSVKVLSGEKGALAGDLRRTGVPAIVINSTAPAAVLFIDGETPPGADARAHIDRTLAAGGTVFVWGAKPASLPALNALLPAPIVLTERTSSSLLPNRDETAGTWADPVINGLTAADLYFSELRPPEIITRGLDGPLVEQSTVLLRAPAVDWLKWNKQPEESKTGMIIRSERETKPSGVALIAKQVGPGRLLVTTLPAAPRIAKAEQAVRTLLANLGIPLEQGTASRAIERNGTVVRTLVLGSFAAPTLQEAAALSVVDPKKGQDFRAEKQIDRKPWRLQHAESGLFALDKMGLNPKNNAVAYLSFWISSPRSLEDLLIEPDMPVVGLEFDADDALQVWLNGKLVAEKLRTGPISGGRATAHALKLQQGWNHVLVKVINVDGGWQFAGRLTCNQPDFLADLVSSPEKP